MLRVPWCSRHNSCDCTEICCCGTGCTHRRTRQLQTNSCDNCPGGCRERLSMDTCMSRFLRRFCLPTDQCHSNINQCHSIMSQCLGNRRLVFVLHRSCHISTISVTKLNSGASVHFHDRLAMGCKRTRKYFTELHLLGSVGDACEGWEAFSSVQADTVGGQCRGA